MFATTELTCTMYSQLCDVHFSLFNIFLLKMVDICSIVAQKDCLDDHLCKPIERRVVFANTWC